jgi:hypothetical protein
MRIVMEVLSFGGAVYILLHVVASFRRVTLPCIRDFGREQTFFYVLRVGPVSFVGWQIVVFEAAVALLAVSFMALAVYLFIIT